MARLNTAGKKHFGELSKHALGYGAALVGGAGVVGGLEAVVSASEAAQVSQAKLQAQLKASGISYSANSKQIDDVIAKTSAYSGFLDRDLESALTSIVRSTGNLHDSYRLLGLATDVARAKNIDVASAGALVAKVQAGQTRVLKSLGIAMDPVTKAQDALKVSTKNATEEQKRAAVAEDKRATAQKALALLQQRLSGQAQAYGQTTAGSLDKMKAAVDNLEVRLGKALAPTIQSVADHVAKFVTQMQTGEGAGGRFAAKMKTVADDVGKVLTVVKDVAGWLGKHPALLAAAGAAWVAYKSAALAQIAIVRVASLGLFGPAMKAKLATEAEGAGSATGSAFATKAGLVVAAAFAGWQIGSWLRKNVPAIKSAGDFIGNALGQAIFGSAQERLRVTSGQLADTIQKATGDALNAMATPRQRKSQTTHPDRLPKGRPKVHKGSVTAGASTAGGTSSVTAHAASGDGASPVASSASSTGSYGLANLIASKFGLSISSGYRSPQHNAAIGGAPNSWHTKGTVSNPGAIDLVGPMSQMQAALAWVQANVPNLAEAMIDNYAGLGDNLHIAGPGLMNWRGGAAGQAGAATGSATGSAPSGSPKASQAPKIPVHQAGSLPNLGQNPPLKNIFDSGTYNAWWARMHPAAAAPKFAVDQSLNNPWLQAALTHYDNLAAAGLMTTDQANAAKASVLTNALNDPKGLTGDDRLVAQGMIQSLKPQGTSAYDTVEGDLSKIDLHVRAGDETAGQGTQDKISRIQSALANPVGLSADDILELRAELGDLTNALTDNTAQLQQQNSVLQQQVDVANRALAIAQSEERTLGRALASQIGLVLGTRAGMSARTPTAAIAY